MPKEEIDLPTIDPSINVTNENGDDDLIYVKYILPPPVNPPQLIHPRYRYRKKVKQLRGKEGEYKKRAKRRAVQTLIKTRKKAIDNALLKNATAQSNIDDENVDIDFRVTIPDEPDNEDDVNFQIEKAGSKNDDGDVIFVKYVPPPPDDPDPPIQARNRLKQRQKKEKYRLNAKKKAIKYLNKRKVEMLLKDQKKNTKIPVWKVPIQNIEKIHLLIMKMMQTFKSKQQVVKMMMEM